MDDVVTGVVEEADEEAGQARRLRVYLWRSASAVEAEIVTEVEALDADYAIVLAMERYGLTWVAAAWVVSVDDDTGSREAIDYSSEDIWLLSFEEFQSFVRHGLQVGGIDGGT